eukprot:365335-Chlamydomonas_euryale.AAC.7
MRRVQQGFHVESKGAEVRKERIEERAGRLIQRIHAACEHNLHRGLPCGMGALAHMVTRTAVHPSAQAYLCKAAARLGNCSRRPSALLSVRAGARHQHVHQRGLCREINCGADNARLRLEDLLNVAHTPATLHT